MLAENLSDLFQRNLEFAYDCEQHLLKELPKLANSVSSVDLRSAAGRHLEETKLHVDRLEQVFSLLKRAPAAETNHALRSITSESERLIKHIDRSALLDTALLVTATQVEHYEIALYGSTCSLGRLLGLNEAVNVLKKTLFEEETANQEFTRIATSSVNPAAVGFQNSPHGIVVI